MTKHAPPLLWFIVYVFWPIFHPRLDHVVCERHLMGLREAIQQRTVITTLGYFFKVHLKTRDGGEGGNRAGSCLQLDVFTLLVPVIEKSNE